MLCAMDGERKPARASGVYWKGRKPSCQVGWTDSAQLDQRVQVKVVPAGGLAAPEPIG